MPLEETPIQIQDVDDVRHVLGAVLNYFVARDLQSAQVELRNNRPSPLTLEIERIKDKFDAYLGDYLLRRHETDLEEDDLDDQELLEEAEEGSESVSEASEEPLSGSPLGEFKPPKQKGRRVEPKDV